MEAFPAAVISAGFFVCLVFASTYVFWRKAWFFRNPERTVPQGEKVVSPADGTVVYVERRSPREEVISIKRNRPVRISDIVKEDMEEQKLLIGIFMSPFDVHYNRAPISGRVDFIRHHPAEGKNRHMTSMHGRTLLNRVPLYAGSLHVLVNERTVTRLTGVFKGVPVSCYLVQIAGGSVRGIDSYFAPGDRLKRGEIFGMIRIGSQVDMVISWKDSMKVNVRPGDKVRAGESVLIE
ncbi:MAG: phosphatidylserine decarboxylase [Desulfobacteraceae bacterium]|jgi:phosphatidylserine decarboxylase|nr:MAG: phosphatidylserine decarboxylase [Desulfobacteraceae bacterium]